MIESHKRKIKNPQKPRILVTAPSNSAVDEIIRRILSEGFRDGNANRYNPNIVRIGVGAATSVEPVTLSTISKSVYFIYYSMICLIKQEKNLFHQDKLK